MGRQINHKTMRIIIGVIALLLAPTVYLLAEPGKALHSISISYWTDAHDIFVGSLIVVGFFMSAYNGTGGSKDWEFYLSKAAFVFAICIALFPTKGYDNTDIPSAWVVSVASFFNLQPMNIHYTAAVLLFVCLIAMMWFFSNRAKSKGKVKRAYIYRTISILMMAGILILFILGKLIYTWENTVLIIEIWGLTLFGIGWLVAGSYKTDPSLN